MDPAVPLPRTKLSSRDHRFHCVLVPRTCPCWRQDLDVGGGGTAHHSVHGKKRDCTVWGCSPKYLFHSACSVQSIIDRRAAQQFEIREKCSAHFQQRKHDRVGNAARGLIRIAGGEGDRPPQAALSLIQVPGRFQNHVAGEQREGALTDRSHKQIFRGNVFSSQRPGAIDFFAPKLFTDLWDWQIFESLSAPPSIPSTLTGALRGGWGFPPCLVAFLASIGYFRTTDATSTSLDSRF